MPARPSHPSLCCPSVCLAAQATHTVCLCVCARRMCAWHLFRWHVFPALSFCRSHSALTVFLYLVVLLVASLALAPMSGAGWSGQATYERRGRDGVWACVQVCVHVRKCAACMPVCLYACVPVWLTPLSVVFPRKCEENLSYCARQSVCVKPALCGDRLCRQAPSPIPSQGSFTEIIGWCCGGGGGGGGRWRAVTALTRWLAGIAPNVVVSKTPSQTKAARCAPQRDLRAWSTFWLRCTRMRAR